MGWRRRACPMPHPLAHSKFAPILCLFEQITHLLSLLKGDFGIRAVFDGVLVFFWRPNALGATMHATASLATHGRRPTAATDAGPCSATGTLEHGDGVSGVGATRFAHRFSSSVGFFPVFTLPTMAWPPHSTLSFRP
jgi:hypothetical protein